MSRLLDQYKGTLIGFAVGDVLGTPFEFWKKEAVRRHIRKHGLQVVPFKRGNREFPAGYYSDDTSMMICLTESLLERGFAVEHQFEKYRLWYLVGYGTPQPEVGRPYGIGQQTHVAMMYSTMQPIDLSQSDERAGGNGSLMHSAPIGLRYVGGYDVIKERSLLSSYVTHPNKIAAWCCVVLNAMIALMLEGTTNLDLPNRVIKKYDDLPDELYNMLQTDFYNLSEKELAISGYSLDTLRIALWGFLTTHTFEEAITKVISLGNDTDTFAAVTGALAGCYYGYTEIPTAWRSKVINHKKILSLALKLHRLMTLKNMDCIIVKLSDLKVGPIRRQSLPDSFVQRVIRNKQVLAEVDTSSLERTLESFRRDLHPEYQLKIWEHIAAVYQRFTVANQGFSISQKKEVFGVILDLTTGMEAVDPIRTLTKETVDEIIKVEGSNASEGTTKL